MISFIKTLIIAFLALTPSPSPAATLTPAASSVPSVINLPILMYHYVENVRDQKDAIRKKLDISPSIFEEQLKTLSENGYETIFIKDLGLYFDNKNSLPKDRKAIILTFDDGYKDFYTDVYPILKKYNAKATAYIIYNFLDKPNYMSKSDIKEVYSSGLVEIASHTLNHPNLKFLKKEEAEKEIADSKKQLEDLIKSPVTDFAYPYGAYNQTAEDIVGSAGFLTAAAVINGQTQIAAERFKLKRLRPGSRTGNNLLNFLKTTPGPL